MEEKRQQHERFGPLAWEDVGVGLHHLGLRRHSATLVGEGLYIFGGSLRGRILSDALRVVKRNQTGYEETLVELQDVDERPAPRNWHTTHLVDDRLYVLGGLVGYAEVSSEVYAFDLVLKR